MAVLRCERLATGNVDAAIASLGTVTLARTPVGAFVEVEDQLVDRARRALAFAGVRVGISLETLAPHLKQCHLKDANKTRQRGAWGEEVPVGTGQVDWRAFFQTLENLRFSGYLAIEREAGQQRLQDILAARTFIESIADTR